MNSLLPPNPAARPSVIAHPSFLQAMEEGGLVILKISLSFPVYQLPIFFHTYGNFWSFFKNVVRGTKKRG